MLTQSFHEDISSLVLVIGLSHGDVALRLLERLSLHCMELLRAGPGRPEIPLQGARGAQTKAVVVEALTKKTVCS